MYELVLVGPVTGNSHLIMIVSSSQHVPTPTRGEIYDDELGLALLHEGRPLVLRFDELHVFDGSWGEFFYELVGKFLHVLSNNRALLLCLHWPLALHPAIWRIGASLSLFRVVSYPHFCWSYQSPVSGVMGGGGSGVHLVYSYNLMYLEFLLLDF